MIRTIIRIDKDKCNGCGACADACHEGAIDIINGKAELVREHFCDGLGDCLPECPTGAISFEEREAPEYDEEAVKEAQNKKIAQNQALSTHRLPVQTTSQGQVQWIANMALNISLSLSFFMILHILCCLY